MIKLVKNEFFIYCKETRIESNRSFYGSFSLGPFDAGQSITIANALRRTLLSELKGLAITSAEIEGAFHEYSTLPGVRDSILDILLNLKDIVLKSVNYGNKKKGTSSAATFKNKQIGYLKTRGPGIVTASELKLPPGIQCVDPDQYIATLSEEGILNLKIHINEGKNYVIQNSNLDQNPLKKEPQGGAASFLAKQALLPSAAKQAALKGSAKQGLLARAVSPNLFSASAAKTNGGPNSPIITPIRHHIRRTLSNWNRLAPFFILRKTKTPLLAAQAKEGACFPSVASTAKQAPEGKQGGGSSIAPLALLGVASPTKEQSLASPRRGRSKPSVLASSPSGTSQNQKGLLRTKQAPFEKNSAHSIRTTHNESDYGVTLFFSSEKLKDSSQTRSSFAQKVKNRLHSKVPFKELKKGEATLSKENWDIGVLIPSDQSWKEPLIIFKNFMRQSNSGFKITKDGGVENMKTRRLWFHKIKTPFLLNLLLQASCFPSGGCFFPFGDGLLRAKQPLLASQKHGQATEGKQGPRLKKLPPYAMSVFASKKKEGGHSDLGKRKPSILQRSSSVLGQRASAEKTNGKTAVDSKSKYIPLFTNKKKNSAPFYPKGSFVEGGLGASKALPLAIDAVFMPVNKVNYIIETNEQSVMLTQVSNISSLPFLTPPWHMNLTATNSATCEVSSPVLSRNNSTISFSPFCMRSNRVEKQRLCEAIPLLKKAKKSVKNRQSVLLERCLLPFGCLSSLRALASPSKKEKKQAVPKGEEASVPFYFSSLSFFLPNAKQMKKKKAFSSLLGQRSSRKKRNETPVRVKRSFLARSERNSGLLLNNQRDHKRRTRINAKRTVGLFFKSAAAHNMISAASFSCFFPKGDGEGSSSQSNKPSFSPLGLLRSLQRAPSCFARKKKQSPKKKGLLFASQNRHTALGLFSINWPGGSLEGGQKRLMPFGRQTFRHSPDSPPGLLGCRARRSNMRLKDHQTKTSLKNNIILEIWTNGSIHPRQALYESCKNLLSLFSKLEKATPLAFPPNQYGYV